MDTFLRRVQLQRELEQEADIIATEVKDLRAPSCRVCGGTIYLTELPQLTVCSGCGGRKRERRLQDEDRARERARGRAAWLLELAGIPIHKERVMAPATEKQCSKCGKGLRSHNSKGVCSDQVRCARRASGEVDDAELEEVGDEKAPKAPRSKDVRKKFRAVAEALGLDGDELLDAFCEGWLAKVRSSVSPDA